MLLARRQLSKAVLIRGRRNKLVGVSRACPLFVPLVEEGWTDNDVVQMTVKAYLGSLKQSGIDTLILGCTHYPLIKKVIRKFMRSGVRLVDSAEETVKEVESDLKKGILTRKKSNAIHSFFAPMLPSDSSRSAAAFRVKKWSRRCASNARLAAMLSFNNGCNRR